jgi:hypothetical protein
MGAVMYGETAAGYGRPRLLAYGRPRPNYVQKIRPAAAAANMSRIKCHALVPSVGTRTALRQCLLLVSTHPTGLINPIWG